MASIAREMRSAKARLTGAEAAFMAEALTRRRFELTQGAGGEAALPPEAAALVQMALAYAASALERLAEQSSRIRELENLSITDSLTGLLNRRGFDGAFARCLANAQRHNEEGLVAFLDLDGFKAVNDTLGHDAGDAVLKHVAQVLRQEVRTTDYLARLGGDEFAMLFTRADKTALPTISKKLKGALAREAAVIGNQSLHVRASIGLVRYDRESIAETLMAAADKAMYRDKARSREKTRLGRAA